MTYEGYKRLYMDFLIGLSIFLCLGHVIKAQISIRTKCTSAGEKCYTLYRADFTWQEAHDSCLTRNQHLATIRDERTQSFMEEFVIEQKYPEGAAHAWVAGRRSDDMTWRYINGAIFNYDGYIQSEHDQSRLCLLLSGIRRYGSNGRLHLAAPCYDTSAYKAVCEYDPPGSGCPSDIRTILQHSVNKCNTVSIERYQSWQDARQYCQSQGWELAHTGAGSWDFYNKLTLTDKPLIGDEAAFWIGVQRRPYVWIQDASRGSHMTITYWRSQEGVSSTEGCMHIELNGRGLWADKSCVVTSAYFFCEHNKEEIFTAEQPAFSTIPSTLSTLPTIPEDCEYTMWYFITGVIGAVLLIENVVFTVIFLMRKRNPFTKQTDVSTSVATDYVKVPGSQPSQHITESPNNLLDPESVVYEDLLNFLTDDYITATDGSTVPGHRQNEAYSTLDGQTKVTPQPNVYDTVQQDGGQYENI